MNRLRPFGIIIIATLFTSAAQILYKLGVSGIGSNFNILNFYLASGILLYTIAAVLVTIAFKQGKISVLYPLFATSYIWVSILSSYFLNEGIGQVKLLGIAAIITGVAFIGLGEKKLKNESDADGY